MQGVGAATAVDIVGHVDAVKPATLLRLVL
jgi:hypothetical protein